MEKRIGIFVVMAIIIGGVVYFQATASAQPGDAGDPLVTRRYVDERIARLEAEIDSLRGQMGLAPVPAVDIPSQPMIQWGDAAAAGVVPFEAVFVPAGYALTAEAGVEFILRSGHAIAVSGADGMVNVTAGRDVVNGEEVPHNNLILVPRSDGRGLSVITDSWIMIKGLYDVVG